ncbi:MAG: cysteine desulfurase [Clostridiales Family XIII bacterium]|jgi:cysteine desulfurase|nr:cysteine desulfurase [Clostridiales Family XIII bacterium]
MQVYLDNSATTKVYEEVAAPVYRALTEGYGNPSSIHAMGQDAERVLKRARQQVASAMNARPENIIFTGSGTESDNLALHAVFRNTGRISGRKLIISEVEHAAVREQAAYLKSLGVEVVLLPVSPVGGDSPGIIDMGALAEALDETVAMISVTHVNNETGVIQPIGEIRKRVPKGDILIHTDAVQSFGKLPIDVEAGELGQIDMISISAHKIHGPKGVGALCAARPEKLSPLIRGGGQEGGLRSGTQNVPGIAGFGAAAEIISADITAHAKQAAILRQRLLDGIMGHISDVSLNSPREASDSGRPGCCSPYILNVSFLGTRGEVLVHDLERSGIYVSTGSACASLKKDKRGINPVLAAIGLTKEAAEGALRFSFSRYNTPAEIDYTLEHLKAAVERFRKVGTFR